MRYQLRCFMAGFRLIGQAWREFKSHDILGHPENSASKRSTNHMPVTIKTPQEIEKMRVAGRLASEVLDYIAPFVKVGVTTNELDRLCHDYIVNVQHGIPAPLDYAPQRTAPYPKSICTSINHQVCHGVPGDKALKNGDIVNHGHHRHQGRLPRRQQPHVLCRRTFHPGQALMRSHLASNVARHPRSQARRVSGRHRPCHPELRRAAGL